MKSEEHQVTSLGAWWLNRTSLQVLCIWNEEIQASMVLRKTKNMCYSTVLACIWEQFPIPRGHYNYLERRFKGDLVLCVRSLGSLYILAGACTWRGLFSEFYGIKTWSSSKIYSSTQRIFTSLIYVWYIMTKYCLVFARWPLNFALT